jgi:hypothetical protein
MRFQFSRGAVIPAVLLVAAFMAASAGFAGVGATQSEFLKIGLSARAAAMGGAFGAVADDLGALEYNPAGLGLLSNSQVSALGALWLADVKYGALAGAHVVPMLGTIGAGVNAFDAGGIEGSTRDFNAGSFLFRAGWARSLTDNFTLGIAAKVLQEKISDFASTGGTVDAGVIVTPFRGVNLAAAAMNIGKASAFESEGDSLPVLVKFAGAAKVIEGDYGMMVVAADVDYYPAPASLFSPCFGMEYWGQKFIALRLGYAYKQQDLSPIVGATAGIGIRWEMLRMDFAYAPFAALGNTYRVTMNWEIWPLVTTPVPGASVGELRATASALQLPPAPPFLAAEAGEGNALLRWEEAQLSDVSGYNVYYRKEGERNFRKFNEEPVAGTTLVVGGLLPSTRYHFVVRAVDGASPPRESAPSPQATAVPY